MLLAKSISVKENYYKKFDTNHQFVRIFLQKKGKTRTIILNIYSRPKERHEGFAEFFSVAKLAAYAKNQLVVAATSTHITHRGNTTKTPPKETR